MSAEVSVSHYYAVSVMETTWTYCYVHFHMMIYIIKNKFQLCISFRTFLLTRFLKDTLYCLCVRPVLFKFWYQQLVSTLIIPLNENNANWFTAEIINSTLVHVETSIPNWSSCTIFKFHFHLLLSPLLSSLNVFQWRTTIIHCVSYISLTDLILPYSFYVESQPTEI